MHTATVGTLRGEDPAVAAREDLDLVSVLFIADDPNLAELYRVKLELDGYRVTIVGAEEATQTRVRRRLPDLIYLDIRAPHRERIEVLKTLRMNRSTKFIPVVILSDYREEELIGAGARLSVDEYLVNSSTQRTLSTSIDRWSMRLRELDTATRA